MSVSSTERSIKCRLRQHAKVAAFKQIQECQDFLAYCSTIKEESPGEPVEMYKPGQVIISGRVFEVVPNAEGYEVSKRVYRMLCDHPGKLVKFDNLLKLCGREIKAGQVSAVEVEQR